jgi:hypothetical protein
MVTPLSTVARCALSRFASSRPWLTLSRINPHTNDSRDNRTSPVASCRRQPWREPGALVFDDDGRAESKCGHKKRCADDSEERKWPHFLEQKSHERKNAAPSR